MTAPRQHRPAHLYVHVPFCARRCTYCDFSIAVRREPPVAAFLAALERELARLEAPANPVTVYLGGGTPSSLGGEGIARLAALLGLKGAPAEFTIEANPEDVTPDAVRGWVRSGVNRLSLGAQSFDDAVLAWMHRTHRAARIGDAVRAARQGGIWNVSIDLIFALPDELGRDWRRDLEAAVGLEPDHVSLYGLTLEPGTALFRRQERGELAACSEQRYADEYLLAHERLAAAGYRFYEVSNAAHPGREAVHNRAYWTLAPYLGVGPSAHSFDGVSRWWNEPAYARWQRLLVEGRAPVAGREILGDHQRRLEQIYLGLRTSEGVGLPEPVAEPLGRQLARWVAAGWAVMESGSGPATTPAGDGMGNPEVRGAPTPERVAAEGPLVAVREPVRRVRLTPQGWLRLDELVATI